MGNLIFVGWKGGGGGRSPPQKEQARESSNLLSISGEKIGEGISTLIHLFNPQVLVIGGKIADAGELITMPIQQILNKYTLTRLKNQCEIKLSNLNSHSTILGTLMVVMKNLYYDSDSNFSLY